MSSATLCRLSDLPPEQCACKHHRGDPGVMTLDDLGAGYLSAGGRSVELAAGPDQIMARWVATGNDECGLCGEPIRKGQLMGMDTSSALVCVDCLPDRGGHARPWTPEIEPRQPEPTPVPIPDLLKRTAHPNPEAS